MPSKPSDHDRTDDKLSVQRGNFSILFSYATWQLLPLIMANLLKLPRHDKLETFAGRRKRSPDNVFF